MSASTIPTQSGYAAQASPVASHIHTALMNSERSTQTTSLQDGQVEPARLPKAPQPSTSDAAQTQHAADTSRVTHKTDIDWSTKSLVYRVIDSRSGQVVSQSPDEALLRMRAYARQVDAQAASDQASSHCVSREL